jgi:hypothetical protein
MRGRLAVVPAPPRLSLTVDVSQPLGRVPRWETLRGDSI